MSRASARAFCALAILSVVGCTSPTEVGEACIDSADCAVGSSCFEQEGAAVGPVCMADCDLTTTRLCADGAVCTPADGVDRPPELGVCYAGGTVAAGAPCMRNLECELGTICVETPEAQACFRACAVDDGSACEVGETCLPLHDMGTNGYCQPDP